MVAGAAVVAGVTVVAGATEVAGVAVRAGTAVGEWGGACLSVTALIAQR